MDLIFKYHICITDNETGETLTNEDCCAIFGGGEAKDSSGSREVQFCYASCGPLELLAGFCITQALLINVARKNDVIKAAVESGIVDKVTGTPELSSEFDESFKQAVIRFPNIEKKE